jgi:flavin-dependent dehydrogenase
MMRSPDSTVLPSTVAVDEAAQRRWDVVVAGAGPAGAVAARQLAIQGVSVLLVDKGTFPRWKVCGCCLNGATLGALETLGLGDLVPGLGARRLSRMRLAVGPTQATLQLPEGVALSREALDSALIREAITAGAAFLSRTEAVLLPGANSVCTVRLRSGSVESNTVARLAVAADGLGGTFLKMADGMAPDVRPASPIGVGAVFDDVPVFFEPGTIFMACGRGAYVGAVRLEDGRLDVAAAVNRARLRESSGIGPLLCETLQACGFPVPRGWAAADWRGTPPLTRFRSRMAHHRLFVVGDSAGYVEPFTGEGISWAIQGAVLLVSYVLDALDRWTADLPAQWDTRYRRFFRARKKVCVLVRKVLEHRSAARATVALLGRAPWLASRWVKEISSLDAEIAAIAEGRTR